MAEDDEPNPDRVGLIVIEPGRPFLQYGVIQRMECLVPQNTAKSILRTAKYLCDSERIKSTNLGSLKITLSNLRTVRGDPSFTLEENEEVDKLIAQIEIELTRRGETIPELDEGTTPPRSGGGRKLGQDER